ncbi:MAG: VOC family protein [Longimicrobiales bacterium]
MEYLKIELLTHMPRALRDFYQDRLGLPVARYDGSAVSLRVGATTIDFAPTNQGEPVYHLAFNIPENKIESALEWLTSRAVLLPHYQSGRTIVDWPDWNAHSIYFLDPAGNVLEVIARHDLDNAVSGAFGPADLLNVSELGLVVDDPHATLDLLRRELGVRNKSVLSDFGAVGDDHGLFIVSAVNRPWMPTDDRPARPFPARVVIRHERPLELAIPGAPYVVEGSDVV